MAKKTSYEEMDNDELLAKYVALDKQQRTHEDSTSELKKEKKKIEDLMLPRWLNHGISKANCMGMTVHVKRTVFGSAGGDVPRLAEALRLAGQDDMVKDSVHAGVLSAWVREHDPDNRLSPEEITAALPEEVREAIKVTEKTELRIRKGD